MSIFDRNTWSAWDKGSLFGTALGSLAATAYYIQTGSILGVMFTGTPMIIALPFVIGGGAIVGSFLFSTMFAAGSMLVHNTGLAGPLGVPDKDRMAELAKSPPQPPAINMAALQSEIEANEATLNTMRAEASGRVKGPFTARLEAERAAAAAMGQKTVR